MSAKKTPIKNFGIDHLIMGEITEVP